MQANQRDDTQDAASRKLFALMFNSASVLIALWAIINPDPWDVVMVLLVTLPWLALALGLSDPRLLRVSAQQGGREANVALGLMFLCIALPMRCSNFHLFSFSDGEWLTLPAAIAFFLLATLADTSVKRPFVRLILLLGLAAAYGYGSGVGVNALLDRSPGTQYSARVAKKTAYRGQRYSSYKLQLDNWGPQQEPSVVRVSSRLYNRTAVGGYVCVTARGGAFAVPWYSVHACE